MSDRDWRATFNNEFAQPPSAVEQRIWRDVLGEEHPERFGTSSFITVSELGRICDAVQLAAEDVLLGRLVATTWDYHSQPDGRPPQVADHRPLLTAVGLRILAYEETDSWRERITSITDRLLEAVEDLAVETGTDPNELGDKPKEMAATTACMIRRVMFIAVRS